MKDESRVMRSAFALLALGMFLLTGCDNRGSGDAGATPEVAVVKLKTEKLTLTTELPGRTRPYRVAEVRPQVSGIVLKRQFREGSDVTKGQSLYQIDPATYKTAFDSAQGELAKAQASAELSHLTVKRYIPLLGTHYVSTQDYDKAIATAKQADAVVVAAQASLEKARINLLYTQVNSPIRGRIGKSTVSEGALVTAGQPTALASVQQLDPIYVDVSQSSTDFLNLKKELAKGALKLDSESIVVDLILEDGSLYSEKGTLQFSDVTVDETTGSITLRAIFPNPNQELLPGMFVRARIKEGIKEKAVMAPQQGITRNARGQATALVVDEQGKIVLRTLATGKAIGDKWLIASGLQAGERIIVSGQQKIRPGMIVKAIDAEEDTGIKVAADKVPASVRKSG